MIKSKERVIPVDVDLEPVVSLALCHFNQTDKVGKMHDHLVTSQAGHPYAGPFSICEFCT